MQDYLKFQTVKRMYIESKIDPRLRQIVISTQMSLKLVCVDEDLLQVDNTAFFFGQTEEMLMKGKKGRIVCSSIKAFQENISIRPEWRTFDLQLVGAISQTKFDEALEIYETNQSICEEYINYMTVEEMRTYLSALESWFALIVEPRPEKRLDWAAWQKREEMKFIEGVTSYCLPSLRRFIDVDQSTNARVQRQNNWDLINGR